MDWNHPKIIYIIYKCNTIWCKDYVGDSFFSDIFILTNDFESNHEADTPLKISNCELESRKGCKSGSLSLFRERKHTTSFTLQLSTIIYEEKKKEFQDYSIDYLISPINMKFHILILRVQDQIIIIIHIFFFQNMMMKKIYLITIMQLFH